MKNKALLTITLLLILNYYSFSQKIDGYREKDGRGLYSEADNYTNIKLTTLSEYIIPRNNYLFCVDPNDSSSYIYNEFEFLKLSELSLNSSIEEVQSKVVLSNSIDKTTEMKEYIEIVDMQVEENSDISEVFVKNRTLEHSMAIEFPSINQENEVKILTKRNPSFQYHKFLYALNHLGLKKNSGDQLFINDEDESKFLIIWLKDHKVFANYLNNNGEWQFIEAKIIHEEVKCYEANGNTYMQRDLSASIQRRSAIRSLNSIKFGDQYFVGYSFNTWDMSNCFKNEIASVHILLLNDDLSIKTTTQIPRIIYINEPPIFSTYLHAAIYKNQSNVFCVIQSQDNKLFVESFSNELNSYSKLKYLSMERMGDTKIVPLPAIPIDSGLVITYKQAKPFSKNLYSQFIRNTGKVYNATVIWTSESSDYDKIGAFNATLLNRTINYDIIDYDKNTEFQVYHKCILSIDSLFKTINYKISNKNWKEDARIKSINNYSKIVDSDVKNKKFAKFVAKSTEGKIKEIYVDETFKIKKYTKTTADKDRLLIISNYYNANMTICKSEIIVNEKSREGKEDNFIITVYYNDNGVSFWEVRNLNGVDDYSFNSRRHSSFFLNGENIQNPFLGFHDK